MEANDNDGGKMLQNALKAPQSSARQRRIVVASTLIGATVESVRLLYLRHHFGAVSQQTVLPDLRADHWHPAGVHGLRDSVGGAADWRRDRGAHRRPDREEDHALLELPAHGARHHADRLPSHVRDGGPPGRRAPRAAEDHAGPFGRRRIRGRGDRAHRACGDLEAELLRHPVSGRYPAGAAPRQRNLLHRYRSRPGRADGLGLAESPSCSAP